VTAPPPPAAMNCRLQVSEPRQGGQHPAAFQVAAAVTGVIVD
jgi:hypothetical protein